MKSFYCLGVISLQMLILPVFSTNGVLANPNPVTSEPALVAQARETKVVELTIEPPLTPEQKTKLQEIDTKYQAKIQEAKQQYIDSLKAIDELLGTNPSNEMLRDRYNQAQNSGNNLSNLLIERLLEFRGVLTPEQQASLSDDIRSYLRSPESERP